jgi:hypothetical protein
VGLLPGPHSSGPTRAVAPLMCDAGRLLYKHGGSADDLSRGPGWYRSPAPALRYFDGAVEDTVTRLLVAVWSRPCRHTIRSVKLKVLWSGGPWTADAAAGQ